MKYLNSILGAKFIGALVSRIYGLKIQECIFLLQGINDSYFIVCENAKYVARVYRHNWRSLEHVQFEADYLSHLASSAAPVANFIRSADGACIQSLSCPEGERFLALMECASGSEYENHAVVNGSPFEYGKAVGILHNSAKNFRPQYSRPALSTDQLIWKPLTEVEVHFADSSTDLVYLREVASPLAEKIQAMDSAGLSKMVIHGDLTGGNANQDIDGRYTFFDFDCCGYGWQAYDLGVFLWSLIQNRKIHLWQDFLAGYRSVAELNAIDEESIGLFVAARSIWIMGYSLARIPVLGSLSYKPAAFKGDVEFIKRVGAELPKNLAAHLECLPTWIKNCD